MRRTVIAIVSAGAVLALVGCSHNQDEPTINIPSTPVQATQPVATPGAGTDAIGGSVTRNMPETPHVVPPKAKPPTKLLTKDIVKGSGQVAGPDSTVTVRYVGLNYATGQEFHSSWQLGGPESFSLVGYVVGFAEGVAGMRAGGRREIVVPPALAYGSGSYGAVGPNETLIFVVDLLKVS